ncbi:HNH endonuclease signature motif containing protein [Blastococcus brunescens]|uniref:HNH endonuclease signature motif containing protein n=1 Tax=Blastococcus brunescens TaxID=1564165 RepID=A0ABZ1ATS4_9ACTN|nr:HNH endonuclease signature motif containing protein [Blastococcus sp. BMG 8361]WRL61978.1 HNH endonuclease signature motif containing protein [Blastococcus sp. BMG 8361]
MTVAELRPAVRDDVLPAGVVSRPSRLGDLLPVGLMTPEQKAVHLQRVVEAEAALAAYRAELVVGLAAHRPAGGDRQQGEAGAASGEWAAQPLDEDVSEFFPDELALILTCSRTAATQSWEVSTTLLRRLPATWAALADGVLDWPRARAIALELGWPGRESPDDVLAAVEAAVLPQAAGLSIHRLRALVRGELIAADPAAADRRRKRAERAADVTVRGLGDGMGEVRATMPYPEAAAVRSAADAQARALKKAGDERAIGQLRSMALHDRMTCPWEDRPAVSAHVEVVASLDTLESAAAGAPGAGRAPVLVDGEPVTAALARDLLERLDALCPGGLQAPTDGTLSLSVVDADGRLLAAVTRRELEAAVRCGQGLGPPPSVDRYQPSPAQRRFARIRDRTCRHPGCGNRAGWADLDHVVAHADGGDTDCTNLCCLCRRHHRLKTHARGWCYAMTPEGVLTVTTPSGVTRVSRPPGMQTAPGSTVLRVAAERQPTADDDPPPF